MINLRNEPFILLGIATVLAPERQRQRQRQRRSWRGHVTMANVSAPHRNVTERMFQVFEPKNM